MYCLSCPTRGRFSRQQAMCYCSSDHYMSGLRCFIFHKVIHVVFSSLGWSSYSPFCLCRYEPQIPLSGFSGSSVWALGRAPQGVSSFQFLLCFNQICDVVCHQFFTSFVLASVFQFNPVCQTVFLACCAVFIIIERITTVLVFSIFADFFVMNVFVSKLFLSFLFFVWMMSRSTLRWVVRNMFSCSFVVAHVPAPYVIVGATTASNRCKRCRGRCDWDVNSC